METKQHFWNISLNFNLRNPRSSKPTIIYAIIRIGGKQYKINTGVKIIASQWNFHLQTVNSSMVNDIDWHNNQVVLNILNIYRLGMIHLQSYICKKCIILNNNNNILHLFTNIIKYKKDNMMKLDDIKKRDGNNSITMWLSRYIEENKQGNTLIKERQNIGLLKRFFLDNPQWNDDFGQISFEMINASFRYMEEITMPNGKKYSISTLREAQKKIKAALKVATNRENRKFDWTTSEIEEVQLSKNIIPTAERGTKNAPLTSEEVALLREYKCCGAQETARDLFLIQCYSGQRKSDLIKLLDSNNIDWDKHIITVKQTKTKQIAYVPMKDSLLIHLIQKYEGQIQKLPAKYNENLRRIAKNIGLTRIIEFTEQRGNYIEEKKGPIYELIHSHLGRHTFISRMAEAGAKMEEVKAITGHTCDATVENIYTHINRLEAAQKGAEYQKTMYATKTDETASITPTIDNPMLNMIMDLKIECRDLKQKKEILDAELTSIRKRQEYEEGVEEIEWLPPTKEDFIVYTV